jgi:hypothetical protein
MLPDTPVIDPSGHEAGLSLGNFDFAKSPGPQRARLLGSSSMAAIDEGTPAGS